jgi:hypothetical protein
MWFFAFLKDVNKTLKTKSVRLEDKIFSFTSIPSLNHQSTIHCMNKFITLLLLVCSSSMYAQDFSIQGVLTEKDQGFPLESATIYVEKMTDSSLITYSISDQKGAFLLRGNTSQLKMRLNISYTGYTSYSQEVALESRNINLDTIKMQISTEALKGVVVRASRVPVTIKKDTLEFNVSSFKTKKDANVEDLLKELPGVEVDANGAITVNGKPVNQILVNGKPFFGDDPTIATRNLTKEIVDKIQIVDTKTESEAFTGEAGSEENKTINITIDEEKNKGIFGRLSAGGGTDKRFEFAGLVNYFDNDVRISALGGGNNTNSPGFSFGELNKMFGGARFISTGSNGSINYGGRQFGGGEGIVNSRVGGANYADELGENTDLTLDYFYTGSSSFNDSESERENILPDSRFFSSRKSNADAETEGHAANLSFKTEIDSTFLINIRPSLSYSNGSSRFSNDEKTKRENGDVSNQSNSDRSTENARRSFENRATATKKWGSGGAYVRVSVENDISDTENDQFDFSVTDIFGDDPETIVRNQTTNGDTKNNQYEIKTTVNYPIIADTLFISGSYEYRDRKREDKRTVFDFNEDAQDYSDFNLAQSTDFTNTDRRTTPELGIRYNSKKMRASASFGYVFRTLESSDALRDIDFDNDFNAVEVRTRFSYNFSDKMSLYSGYSLENEAPSVTKLSPFIDISDPLDIVQGNPDLKPENSHRIYLGLNNYDWQTRSGFYSNASFNLTNDNVVSRSTIDENFVRTTTYDNVDGAYNFYAGGGWNKSKKLDSLRTVKVDMGLYVNGNRTVNFNNDVQYKSATTTVSPNLGFTYTWKDLFEIRPSYDFDISKNSFDLVEFEDENYVTHTARLRTTLTFPKKLDWNSDIQYQNNPNVAAGFNNSFVLWNSSLAYSILSDKAVLTLKAYDLLKQNTNARRSSSANYIEDVQSTVLQQFFMLSFSYKFNTLGKKGETNDNGWWD